MKTLYVIWLNEAEVGPVSMEDLLARKDLTPETHVRAVDAEEWSTWEHLKQQPEAESSTTKKRGREIPKEETSPLEALRRKTAYPVARLLLISLIWLSSAVAVLTWLGFFSEGAANDASSGVWLFYAVVTTILVPVTVALVLFAQAMLDLADCALKKNQP